MTSTLKAEAEMGAEMSEPPKAKHQTDEVGERLWCLRSEEKKGGNGASEKAE